MRNHIKFIFVLVLIFLNLNKCKAQDTEEDRSKKRLERAINYEDSLAKAMNWRPLKDGFSISKYGDIGFKTSYIVSREAVTTYRTFFGCCNDGKSFKDVIDIKTIKQIGGDWAWGGYFKDKNYIYHFWGNSGGGNFEIVNEADYATFEIVNNCYGRDKNHIYDMRFGLMKEINQKEFKILPNGNTCIAKYMNIYYQGNNPISMEDMNDTEIKKAIKELDRYISKTKHLSN
ncbi:DKNYY domain-containing protein [Flavobacterium sp. DG1-102-2]|uniref:DKNYY domain-containing protein n=1 Tax=Flavobacterium sp. DG1-102-2 TaxID=3081663 RepID=UPI0029491903|nr:DKNYY domain-containing protein [Flavobacterium sp. DG1-102-2]MDV6169999.1 DKNYY domain-containing protein [Flavobacterium sp. DG1-102-2]